MQLYRGDAHPKQAQVLDDECVAAGLRSLEHCLPGRFQFVLVDERVEGQKYLYAELMGISGQFGDVIEAVARGFPGTERGAGDIYGIGTAVYGRDADVLILSRSKKL